MQENCVNCKFFNTEERFKHHFMDGTCRRHPPVSKDQNLIDFPFTREDWWCGEWRCRGTGEEE